MTFRVDPAVIRTAAARRDRVYPYAVWAPIPEAVSQPKITVTTGIFHSMAGPRLTTLEALRAYYARDDIHTESTFVGPDFDGRMFQVVHIDQRADANFRANPFAVSWETQDRGSPTLPTTAWSPEQVEQLAGSAAFIHLRDGVPLRAPSTWNGGGIGYHSQFPQWSKYVGKTCPGATRIAQVPAVLARAAEIVAGTTQPRPPRRGVHNMYIFRFRKAGWPGAFVARVTAEKILHVVDGPSADVDIAAGTPVHDGDHAACLAIVRDVSRANVGPNGNPFVGPYFDADLNAAW